MNLDSDTAALREGMENFNYRIVFVDFFYIIFIIYFYEAKKSQKMHALRTSNSLSGKKTPVPVVVFGLLGKPCPAVGHPGDCLFSFLHCSRPFVHGSNLQKSL